MSQPEVTMIVVSWNVREALRRCLSAAMNSRGCLPRVIVIDNNSSDGSADMVAAEFPSIMLIRNKTNRGFAAAVNQGLAHANGHVLLLNPDVEVQAETVATMIEWLHKLPNVGIVGAHLQYPDGTIQPSVKRFPRWRDVALLLTKLPNLFPRLAEQYQQRAFDYTKTQEVDQVMGSCFLIRDEACSQLGLFDEGFFIWYEEVDYCLRAHQAGWKVLFVTAANAIHGRGQSFIQVPTKTKQAYLRDSLRHFARKHFGKTQAILLEPFFALSWVGGIVVDAARLSKPRRAKEF